MSASTTNIPARAPADDEPFGQAGILQHLGKVLNACAITGLMITLAMWYRSTGYVDSFSWHGGTEELQISSIAGRIKITGEVFEGRGNHNAGWGYRTRSFNMVKDAWEDSIWKMIGIEFSTQGSGNGGNGFWIRIKWYFIAGICAAIPAISVLLQWKNWRDEAE